MKKIITLVTCFLLLSNLNAQQNLQGNNDQNIMTNIYEKIVNSEEFNNDGLYNSGKWETDLKLWIDFNIADQQRLSDFIDYFGTLGEKINDPVRYSRFAEKTADYLIKRNKPNYVNHIAETVRNSGKIKNYNGILALYLKGAPDTQAPDLIIKNNELNKNESLIKSSVANDNKYQKTLLVFYSSLCGPCSELINELPKNYDELKKNKVRTIAISADENKEIFMQKVKLFPWSDVYCDFESVKGINFQNYGVSATPTLFLLDQKGKILVRTHTLKEVIDIIQKN